MHSTANDIKHGHPAQVIRPLLLGAVLAGVTVAMIVGLARTATVLLAEVTSGGLADPASVLALGVTALSALLTGWLGLGSVLDAWGHLPGALGRGCRALAARLTPAAARRLTAFLLGVGLGTVGGPGVAVARPGADGAAAVSVSVADPSGPGSRGPAATPPVAPADPSMASWAAAPRVHFPEPADWARDHVDLPEPQAWLGDPRFTPTPPVVRDLPDPSLIAGAPRRTTVEPKTVVVRRGDTLWDLAADHLHAHATDAEIAAAWPRWYAANLAAIGPDPDLLLPGTVLRVPSEPAEVRS